MENKNLRDFRESLNGAVSEEAIEKLSVLIPPELDSHVVMIIAGIVKKLPPDMSPDEMVEAVKRAMMSKQKEHQSQTGEKPGSAKALTRRCYDSMMLEMRLLGAEEPSTGISIFGQEFSSPIMTAALSHLSPYRKGENGKMELLAQGAKEAGCLFWVGMIENDHFAQLMEIGVPTVRIIKPYADEDKIYDQLRRSRELGALAVGMDIDHAMTTLGEEDVAVGERLTRKSLDQMRGYIRAAGLPFVIKGVLSVRDALLAKEIGADAIVVSHHGGRMPFAMPPVLLLPDIRKAVGESLTVFADCGIASGMDAYKAMALGADAVGVGTALLPALQKNGAEGAAQRLREMTAELKGAMSFTGVKDCGSFDASVIHMRSF